MGDVLTKLKDCIEISQGKVTIRNAGKVRELMDGLIYEAVFNQNEEKKLGLQRLIIEIAKQMGAAPSSIQSLYEEMGRNYPGFTVPAINLRGLTYDAARVIFRKAVETGTGAMIFEIARSEIGYTKQRPLEYSAAVLAAAVTEGYSGPVFIQGDHFQLVRKYYLSDPDAEKNYIKGLIREAIDAEFFNIDIDSSTLVDLEQPTLQEQQKPNYAVAAQLTSYIRELEPKGITVSVGGEIGEIGGKNSTPDELRAYLDGFRDSLKRGKGLSKLSVQTGTSHGGVVLPDGSLAKVKIDFDTLKAMSEVARKEYGLSGAVQHGASTLPDEAFHTFPEVGTSEVHLATGFQNILYDNPALPRAFKDEVYAFLKETFPTEQKEGQTEEQFFYKTRKKGFGPLKKKWWDLPASVKEPIMKELSDKFDLLFRKLKVIGSKPLVDKIVRPVVVEKPVADHVLD